MKAKYSIILIGLFNLSGCDFIKGIIENIEPLCKGEGVRCCIIDYGDNRSTAFCSTQAQCEDKFNQTQKYRGYPKMEFTLSHKAIGSEQCYNKVKE